MKYLSFTALRAFLLATLFVTLAPSAAKAQDNKEWFTVVLFGDPEYGMGGADRTDNQATRENGMKWANAIINMHTTGRGRYRFRNQPVGFVPKADMVICMGDIDGDSKRSRTDSEDIFDLFVNAGIPFFTLLGNHDVMPDYFNGGDKGVTWGPAGGQAANEHSFNESNWYRNDTRDKGYVSDMKIYRHGQGQWQIEPFAFTFKGVRFYMGQTYWFQKPYNAPATIFNSATYYAPNDILRELTNDVVAHGNDMPAIWVQHYPIDCADRWWNDTNANGAFIGTQNTPDYPTANDKRNKYKELISRTKNPYHFSGHQHWTYTSTYTVNGKTFKDYVAPYHATQGGAFIVLCNNVDGVVEVQTVDFGTNTYPNNVYGLNELSNSKIYTITTDPSNVNRGALVYDATKGDYVCAQHVETDPSNQNHQWGILHANDSYYLYNIKAKKFATANGNKLTLTEQPTNDSKVAIEYRNGKVGYPWVLRMNGKLLNVNIGSFTPEGLRVGTWSYIDEGNQYSIAEVGDFTNYQEALTPLLYPIDDAARGNSTHTARYTTSVKLQEDDGPVAEIGGLQSATGEKIYWDKTSQFFTCHAGATLHASLGFGSMNAMHTYVFVDEDGDGFSNTVDAVNHCAMAGSDLKSWSGYRFGVQNGTWYNSAGTETDSNDRTLPTFTAPTRPGNYRMRYMVAWDCIDPRGYSNIAEHGGIIVDVTLKVLPTAITSLDQLSNNVVYTIRTHDRGNLRHEGSNNFATAKVAGYDANDEGQQWAIVTKDGKTYLYNVHAKKIACRNDDKKLYMVESPTPDSWVTIVRSNSDDYPWTIKFGSRFLNTTTGSNWGYLVDNGNSGFDDGNRYKITAVGELSATDAERIEYLLRYSVRENAYGNSTSGNRYTRGIALREGDGSAQTVNGLQSDYRQKVYWDKTDQKFTCVRGATLTPSFNFGAMNAMQCCVFVDEDGQGFSGNYDAANHRAVESSDLKSWSGLRFDGKWYNSRGEETTSECRELPPFKAPSRPGTYRMRYMVTWSSVEARGYDNINAHGGIIVDVMLEVTDKVAEVAQLSPDRAYIINTLNCGNLRHEGNNSYVTVKTANYNESDRHQQWSIIKDGDYYYLYNIGQRKYASKNSSNELDLVDAPTVNSRVTFLRSNSDDYPWIIRFSNSGYWLNCNSGYTKGYVVNTYSTQDDGNRFRFVAVDDFPAQDLASVRTAAAAARLELDQRGVGYPTTTCAEYAALKRAVDDAQYAPSGSNDMVLRSRLEAALAAYRTTSNIEQPQTGKYYAIKLVGYNNGDYHVNLSTRDDGDGIVASPTKEPTPFLAINNGDGTFRLVTYTGKYFRVITDYSDISDKSSTGLSEEYTTILNNLTIKKNNVSFKPLGGVRIVGAGGTGGKICSLIFEYNGALAHYSDSDTGVDPGWTNTTVWTEVPAPATLTTAARGTTLVVNGVAVSSAEVYQGDTKVTDGVSVTNNGTSSYIAMPASDTRITYTVFVPGSKAAAANGDNPATGGVGARQFTHTVDQGVMVTVKFINDETGEETVKRNVSTCFGTPVSSLLAAEYPNCVMTDCDHETVTTSVDTYTIHFMPSYDVDLPNKNCARRTEFIYLTPDGTTRQTIATSQTEGASPVYFDLTDQKFYCRAGATLSAAVGDNVSWMHSYVYIDENHDGFAVAEADIVGNTLQASPDIDLRTFSYYNRYRSNGSNQGDACGVGGLPTFTAPTTPGSYRMRYKVDWDCVDPNGNRGDANGRNTIVSNGGIIVDVTLEVYTAETLRRDVLGHRGVGYPTTESTAYATLDAAIAAVEGGSTEYGTLYTALAGYFNSSEIQTMPDDGKYYEIHRVDDKASGSVFLAMQNEGGTFRLAGPKAMYYTGAGYTNAYSASANNLTIVKTGTGINGFGNVRFVGSDAAVRWTEEEAPSFLLARYANGQNGTVIVTVPGLNTIHVAAYHNDTKVDATVDADTDTRIVLPSRSDLSGYTIIVGDATVARVYVLASVTFVNDITGDTEERLWAVPVGTTMGKLLKLLHPSSVVVSATHEAVKAGVSSYTVRYAPVYKVTGLPDMNRQDGAFRNTSSVSLASGSRIAETINTGQPRENGAIYFDRTSERFTCIVGETLEPSVGYTDGWMHAYVYVDEDNDGFAVAEADIVDDVLQSGTGIDLRSYTFFDAENRQSGHNSAGASKSNGCGVADMPSFTAPATPGTYRMRFKVDWNNIDPDGNRTTDNHISDNGGIIVDVTLDVLPEYHDVTIKDGWGYGSYYNSKCNLTVPSGCTAYTFSFDGDNHSRIVANEIESGVIPAGTGVIIKSDDSGTMSFPTVLPRTSVVDDNLLRGTDKQQVVTTENGGTLYMLSRTSEKGVGFYQASQDGKSFTNGAHKAYLDLPADAEAAGIRSFLFDDLFKSNQDGIATNMGLFETDEDGVCHDLSGRRLNSRPKSGVYIMNGKKHVVR